jgi:hypothetical protein
VFFSVTSGEENTHPAHASLHDVMRKMRAVRERFERSAAVERFERLELLEPTSKLL